ncbi:sensor domain-containing diguanylate cyclase [Massilia sp. S19_KUP03_FR1]|uniref:sensor domain-containing diguanylate cyclase n=1 Tax=Massilia sp. S19_KUP03_FR1 TaxID=3025503 RepID=UPI002FCDB914
MTHTQSQSAIDQLDQLRRPMIKRTIILIGCFCFVLVGLNVWGLVATYRGQLQDTAIRTGNMARALASHAERSLKVGDAILGEMVERAERVQAVPEARAHLQGRLRNIAAATPEIQELFLYAPDGARLVTSLPTLLDGRDAEHDFFRYHMTHKDRGTHVGSPIRSRASGVLIIPLTRRIDRPDGSFGGVAMASLSLQFFRKFYDSIDVGKTGTIVLAIDDGTLLYRRPYNPAMLGAKVTGGALATVFKEQGAVGTVMLVSKIDGIERLYSYRHLEGFPLIVAIAQAKPEILAEWWVSMGETSGIVLFSIAVLGWGARRMIGQMRVREALENELRRARDVTESNNVALQALANTDSLTGLANRRHFEKTLTTEQDRARRNGKPCSVILGDVDLFKKYNDHYGHVAGDACLRQVAAAIAAGLRRPADLAARYGGEEFIVILPETDLEGACAVARNIRAKIAAVALAHADSPFGHVTISLGVYTGYASAQDDAPAHWVQKADDLLYQAKAAGRDRFVARQDAPGGAAPANLQLVR